MATFVRFFTTTPQTAAANRLALKCVQQSDTLRKPNARLPLRLFSGLTCKILIGPKKDDLSSY